MDGNSSSMSQKKPQLITFSSNQKICYFEGCKVEINDVEKCLIFEPAAKSAKKHVAKFENRFYYHFKNFLCIIDPAKNGQNFILILKTEKGCKTAFDVIQKNKTKKNINLSTDLLFQRLIRPMLTGMKNNENLKQQLQPIMMDLFICFEAKDQQECMKYMRQTNFINDILNLEIMGSNGTKFLAFVKPFILSNPLSSNDSSSVTVSQPSSSIQPQLKCVSTMTDIESSNTNSLISNSTEQNHIRAGDEVPMEEDEVEDFQINNIDNVPPFSDNQLKMGNVSLEFGDRIFSLVNHRRHPYPADKENYFKVFTGILRTSNGKSCCPYCNVMHGSPCEIFRHVKTVHGKHYDNSQNQYICLKCKCPLKKVGKKCVRISGRKHKRFCRESNWYQYVKDKTCHSI